MDGETPFIIYLSAFALSRITTEFWKLFVRVEPQDDFRIPTQVHWLKGVVHNPALRLLLGAGYLASIYGIYCSFKLLPDGLPMPLKGLIVGGVIIYRQLTGHIDMEPSNLSKFNTLLQITFVLSLIMQQIWPLLPPLWFDTGMVLIAVLAVATGLDYIQTGIRKTRQFSAARDDS